MANPEEMANKMIANMEEKTGKDLAAWLKITKPSGLEKHGQLVKMLKTDHGMTHGFANLVAHMTLDSSAFTTDDKELVDAQYAAGKAGLKPIYDALTKLVGKLGKDAALAPKKAYVSLRRNKQFGLIQPSTKTRVDLGLCLGDEPANGRLEASGSFNSMVSHRVRLTDVKDIDTEVKGWLRKAYDRS